MAEVDPTPDPTTDDDKPAAVIKRLNAESKARREEAERNAAERDALKAKLDEIENAKLVENSKYKELAEKLAAEKDEITKKYESDLKKERREREKSAVRDAAVRALEKRGLIDDRLVDIFDLGTLKFDEGKVTGVDEWADKLVTDSPKLFGSSDNRLRDNAGRYVTPPPSGERSKPSNANNMTDQQFDDFEASLRGYRPV